MMTTNEHQRYDHEAWKQVEIESQKAGDLVLSAYHLGLRAGIAQGRRELWVELPDIRSEEYHKGWDAGRRDLEVNRHRHAMNEASEPVSQSPIMPGEPVRHKPARMMVLHFMNGTHAEIEMDLIHHRGGWHFSDVSGVLNLVVGHGLPRAHYPLCNIRSIELLTEDDL